jgi:glutamine amidotransferase
MNLLANPGTRQVTIIDLGIQNILSVENAFRVIGAEVRIAKNVQDIQNSKFLVLPGVGAFGAAQARLEQTGLAEAIKKHVNECQLPLVGLCLGMQLLATSSDEFGNHLGLDLIPGKVTRLQDQPPDFRVPNIGWRSVLPTGSSCLFPSDQANQSGSSFYHVHSFHFMCDKTDDVAGCSNFGAQTVTSVVHRKNVFGTQFHPEKSQDAGLDLLHAVLHGLS